MSQTAGLSKRELEEGRVFAPRYDSAGLIGAIVTDAAGGGVLMFAYMNAEALRLTLETGEAHFWSRLPAGAVAQGRNQRQPAAGRGGPDRLRPGCALGERQAFRRGGMPYGAAELLLPSGNAGWP